MSTRALLFLARRSHEQDCLLRRAKPLSILCQQTVVYCTTAVLFPSTCCYRCDTQPQLESFIIIRVTAFFWRCRQPHVVECAYVLRFVRDHEFQLILVVISQRYLHHLYSDVWLYKLHSMVLLCRYIDDDDVAIFAERSGRNVLERSIVAVAALFVR